MWFNLIRLISFLFLYYASTNSRLDIHSSMIEKWLLTENNLWSSSGKFILKARCSDEDSLAKLSFPKYKVKNKVKSLI